MGSSDTPRPSRVHRRTEKAGRKHAGTRCADQPQSHGIDEPVQRVGPPDQALTWHASRAALNKAACQCNLCSKQQRQGHTASVFQTLQKQYDCRWRMLLGSGGRDTAHTKAAAAGQPVDSCTGRLKPRDFLTNNGSVIMTDPGWQSLHAARCAPRRAVPSCLLGYEPYFMSLLLTLQAARYAHASFCRRRAPRRWAD